MLKFELRIIEGVFNNTYLIFISYIFMVIVQLIYLKYKLARNNIFLFICNKILMFYFIIYQLLLKKESGSLVYYMLSIFILYLIVTIKENRKNILKIERFFAEDVVIMSIVSVLISYMT